MHNLDLLLTLTSGLAAALILGYITQRIGLSPIVGYLLAGVAVGGRTPGFVADLHLAEQLAEVGVILLMFGVGLQFHLKELLAVRRVAIPGAIGQIVVATLLGILAARAFGWTWSAGFVFGLAISVASTVVLVRVLSDNNDLHTPTGHISVGWLVVEDLFTVVVLVLLPALFGGQPAGAELEVDAVAEVTAVANESIPLAIGLAVVKIAALVAATFIIGGRVIPWLLARVAATGSRELFTLTTLVVALGIAVGSAKLFGVSMALGAFLAGMVVGRSDFSLRAATEALPMRDAFAVLFFVSVGMLFDPNVLMEHPWITSATIAIVLIGKPLAAVIIVLQRGLPFRVAVSVGIALAQIGEFSFILARLGEELGILTELAHHVLIATAIVTISVNPLYYRLIDRVDAWAERRPRLWARMHSRAREMDDAVSGPSHARDLRHHAVIIGYGPVGQTVTLLLKQNDIQPTVVELNLNTVKRLRAQGIPAIYGDAQHLETLKNAGVATADSLILSASGTRGSEEVIRRARSLNPEIRVLARSNYLLETPDLLKAGADTVFSGEAEVALALTEAILRELGATPEQIDRERLRVRDDLCGDIAKSSPRVDVSTVSGDDPALAVTDEPALDSEPATETTPSTNSGN
ncbi:MAG: cation:proton antiporter [Planctomycetaceae bacterium]|nr:cation:proton antiporter [Planctomycetaceae bacterium]